MNVKRHRTSIGALAVVVVLLATSLVIAAGCGGGTTDVTGVYKLEAGEDFTATLTLKAGGEGTYSITEGGGLPVTYEVKDDTVTLIGADGKPVANASFTITDDGLRDPTGNVYKKQ